MDGHLTDSEKTVSLSSTPTSSFSPSSGGTSPIPSTTTLSTREKKRLSKVRESRAVSTSRNERVSNSRETDLDSELSEPSSSAYSLRGLNQAENQTEIVVSNPEESLQTPSDNSDDSMADGVQEHVSPYPKRKRAPTLTYDGTPLISSRTTAPTTSASAAKSANGLSGKNKDKGPRASLGGGVKGVPVGYWRYSSVPKDEDKHAVIGFIDVRGSLRTRIQPCTLFGKPIGPEHPLPAGPGGSWVTFPNIFFLPHLVGLESIQIKEYVKIRTDAHEDSPEQGLAAVKAAAEEARARVSANPYEPNYNPNVAYGADLPESLIMSGRLDIKRRKTSDIFAVTTTSQATPQPSSRPISQGSAGPVRVLIGYWRSSNELDPRDRHAVYGILSQANNFRVKVVRETRDGREVEGNFPPGPDTLWIPWEEVVLDPHLEDLSRQEIKEYCRIRQGQIESPEGETREQRIMNETSAVFHAQNIVARNPIAGPSNNHPTTGTTANDPIRLDTSTREPNGTTASGPAGQELRTSTRRIERQALAAAQAQAQLQAEKDRLSINSNSNENANDNGAQRDRTRRSLNGRQAREKADQLAQKVISRAEGVQDRVDIQAECRQRTLEAVAVNGYRNNGSLEPTSDAPGLSASDDMQRLNSLWARQEASRHKADDDVKVYDGRKYERKKTGPLYGKLVSQGKLINIDGEDYVEYRVLTKPSFF